MATATQTDFEKVVAKHDGWQVWHQQDAAVQNVSDSKGVSTTLTISNGNYVAIKRHPTTTDSLIEIGGATVEEVERRIAEYEGETAGVNAASTILPEHLAESAKATKFMAVSASARDIVSDPDANEKANESRDNTVAVSEVVEKAAKAVEKAVESVTSEVKKAGGSDASAAEAGELAKDAVQRAVNTTAQLEPAKK